MSPVSQRELPTAQDAEHVTLQQKVDEFDAEQQVQTIDEKDQTLGLCASGGEWPPKEDQKDIEPVEKHVTFSLAFSLPPNELRRLRSAQGRAVATPGHGGGVKQYDIIPTYKGFDAIYEYDLQRFGMSSGPPKPVGITKPRKALAQTSMGFGETAIESNANDAHETLDPDISGYQLDQF
jgi:hypothetical protein